MHNFRLNFRRSARDRAGEGSYRAFRPSLKTWNDWNERINSHYLRFRPFIGKIYEPVKKVHSKIVTKFKKQNGKS